MSTIQFQKGIVCDDIRQEINGKYFLVGMYSSTLIPSALPAVTQVAFGIWGKVNESGTHKCEFEIALEADGGPGGRIDVEFEVGEGETEIFIPLPKFSINIKSPGYLVLRERLSELEIIRLKILAPPAVETL